MAGLRTAVQRPDDTVDRQGTALRRTRAAGYGAARGPRALALYGTHSSHSIQHLVTAGISQMCLAAQQIAGPLVAVLFCADIALGLLNRVAPALNVFSIGFPVKILLTLSAAGLGLAILP